MLHRMITRLRDQERGEVLIEYGLIIAIIAIICIGILLSINNSASDNIYGNLTDSLTNSGS